MGRTGSKQSSSSEGETPGVDEQWGTPVEEYKSAAAALAGGSSIVQEGKERVIVYASQSLHPTERNNANYSSFKFEL